MKFYITGTRRGLGYALAQKYKTVDSLIDCDIFINCKHDGFDQVDLLYDATELGKRVISIGSIAQDHTDAFNRYSIEKKALREANHQLFNNGYNVTCINFGYIDTERSAKKDKPKIDLDYATHIVDWIINQPVRIKEITLCK